MAWERMLRVSRQIPHPFAQHILMEVEIPRRLGDRHTPLLDQPHCLKLELATELPSLHWKTPVPSSTPYLGGHGTVRKQLWLNDRSSTSHTQERCNDHRLGGMMKPGSRRTPWRLSE